MAEVNVESNPMVTRPDDPKPVAVERYSDISPHLSAGRKLGVGNAQVFAVILLSALIVVTARVVAPFEIGKDQATQLEAAQRLVEGNGLTTYANAVSDSFEITEAPNPKYLTQWPPAFSILIAGFLFLGFSLSLALKVVYGLATLMGWVGWGVLASHLVAGPIKLGGRPYHCEWIIAALMPVFVTPWWKGTDIFLWAGVPFFVLLLTGAARARPAATAVLLAGLLFGFLYAMRYASIFLGLAALLILLQVSLPNVKAFLKHAFIFMAAALVFIVPVIIYLKLSAQSGSGLEVKINPTSGSSDYMKTLLGMLGVSSVTSYLVFGFPLIDQIAHQIGSRWLKYTIGGTCVLTVFLLPLYLLRNCRSLAKRWQGDLALSLSFVPFSLLGFLILMRLITQEHLFGVRRYYEPVALCGLFIFYEIASRRAAKRAVKAAATSVVAMFLLYVCAYMPLQALLPARRDNLVQSVLGFTPANSQRYPSTSFNIRYPSFRIFSEKENSRLKLKQLHDENPQALFFAKETPLYAYDRFEGGGPVPGKHLKDFPDLEFWKQAHTSKPVKIFWVLETETPIEFIPEANLKLVHRDQIEQTKIYESDFPAGYKFFGR